MPGPVIQSPIVEEDAMPSSDVIIPQSTVKKNKRKDFSADIFDEEISTPTRGPRLARHRTALLPSENQHMFDNIGSSPMPPFARSLSDSFAKVSNARRDMIEETPHKPKDRENMMQATPGAAIHETPTKPSMAISTPSKRRFDDYNDGGDGGVSLGSPLARASMRSYILSTPVGNKRAKPTPLAHAATVEDSPDGNGGGGGVSIYDQLGWDDY
jgi:hypothetical protein